MEKRAQDLMNDCNCNHCATKKALLGVRLTQFSKADFWNHLELVIFHDICLAARKGRTLFQLRLDGDLVRISDETLSWKRPVVIGYSLSGGGTWLQWHSKCILLHQRDKSHAHNTTVFELSSGWSQH